MYMFSIVFTDIVLDHLEDTGEQDTTMEKYFGTLYDSFFTLFRAILNGISWYDAADALRPINLLWVQWFHFYIAFCGLATLRKVEASYPSPSACVAWQVSSQC